MPVQMSSLTADIENKALEDARAIERSRRSFEVAELTRSRTVPAAIRAAYCASTKELVKVRFDIWTLRLNSLSRSDCVTAISNCSANVHCQYSRASLIRLLMMLVHLVVSQLLLTSQVHEQYAERLKCKLQTITRADANNVFNEQHRQEFVHNATQLYAEICRHERDARKLFEGEMGECLVKSNWYFARLLIK